MKAFFLPPLQPGDPSAERPIRPSAQALRQGRGRRARAGGNVCVAIGELKLIEERAQDVEQSGTIPRDMDELRTLNDDYQRLQRGKERNPALWIILSLVTIGILFFYVLWFLNDDLRKHQAAEAEHIEKASAVLNKLGIGRHPTVVEQVVPDRSFPLYLLLTFVTLGLFEFYWAYVRIKDGNDHFLEHERWEDQLVGMIRAVA